MHTPSFSSLSPRRLTALLRSGLATAVRAPLAAAATATALTISVTVGALAASSGHLPAGGPPALICAALLAAVSLSELSRPARTDRRRRRWSATGRTSAASALRFRIP